jgi:DNA-binding FadR family transcriptional regulator
MPKPLKEFNFRSANIPVQLKEVLRKAISEGRLRPGDKLPSEEQMTKQYNVSKTVLREALGQLVAEGLIEKRRGAMGGSFVAKGDPHRILDVVVDCYHLGGLEIEEVIEFRRVIEPVTLELACLRRENQDVEILRHNLDLCQKALDNGRVDRGRQVEFHRLIAKACHNRLLESAVRAAVKISREFTSKLPFSYEEGVEDHEFNKRFFRCILDRKNSDAKDLMKQHFDRSRLLVERYWNMQDKDSAGEHAPEASHGRSQPK